MTIAIEQSQGAESRTFNRILAVIAPAMLAVYAVLQVLSSRWDSDPAVEDRLPEDLTTQLIFGVVATAVVFFVGNWAIRRDRSGQARGVVGLAAGAIALAPLVWWSAAPVLLAAGAITVGRATRATDRGRGSNVPRIVTGLAGLLAVVAFTVLVVGVLVKAF